MTIRILKPFAPGEGRVSDELQSGAESPGGVFSLTLTFGNISLQSVHRLVHAHITAGRKHKLLETDTCHININSSQVVPPTGENSSMAINLVAYMNIL